jgi:hypothetical protein
VINTEYFRMFAESSECAENEIYFMPANLHATVYLLPGQVAPTYEQIQAAIIEAYVQAARRGEVVKLTLSNESR